MIASPKFYESWLYHSHLWDQQPVKQDFADSSI